MAEKEESLAAQRLQGFPNGGDYRIRICDLLRVKQLTPQVAGAAHSWGTCAAVIPRPIKTDSCMNFRIYSLFQLNKKNYQLFPDTA